MNNSSSPIKHGNTFTAALLADIRRNAYSPGEKLPSERGLCVKYGFSRPTIHKNLAELTTQGILEYRGRTAYVSPAAMRLLENESPVGNVVLLMNYDSYSNLIYTALNNILIDRLNTHFALKLVVTDEKGTKLLEKIQKDDVVVVFGHILPDALFKAVSASCRNIFAINFKTKYGNWLMPDNYHAGRMMAETLYAHGHRRIAAVLRTQDNDEFEERFQGANDFLAEHGLAAMRIWTPKGLRFTDIAELFFDRFIRTREITALLSLRQTMSLKLYDLAYQNGLSIPEDFSIVNFDDNYGCDLLNPPLSSCRYPTAAIAEKLITAIFKAFKLDPGKRFIQEKFLPLLVERNSISSIHP
ncbi:MAG: substrate-binding domain-containing protein [Lentisphaeria bacterium]|nr:substrate-binding domain-containing protein [Lentisphaeria bacterium]